MSWATANAVWRMPYYHLQTQTVSENNSIICNKWVLAESYQNYNISQQEIFINFTSPIDKIFKALI